MAPTKRELHDWLARAKEDILMARASLNRPGPIDRAYLWDVVMDAAGSLGEVMTLLEDEAAA